MKGDCACMDNEDEDGDEEGQEAEQDELIYEVSWLCFFFGTSRRPNVNFFSLHSTSITDLPSSLPHYCYNIIAKHLVCATI